MVTVDAPALADGFFGGTTAHMAVTGPSCAGTDFVLERSFHNTSVPSFMPVTGSPPRKAEDTAVRA